MQLKTEKNHCLIRAIVHLSIFLGYSNITRQINEIPDSIFQVAAFVLSTSTCIVYIAFYLFYFVSTGFFLQSKQTLLLMVLEISEVGEIESISCVATETDTWGYLQRRHGQKLSGPGVVIEAVKYHWYAELSQRLDSGYGRYSLKKCKHLKTEDWFMEAEYLIVDLFQLSPLCVWRRYARDSA